MRTHWLYRAFCGLLGFTHEWAKGGSGRQTAGCRSTTGGACPGANFAHTRIRRHTTFGRSNPWAVQKFRHRKGPRYYWRNHSGRCQFYFAECRQRACWRSRYWSGDGWSSSQRRPFGACSHKRYRLRASHQHCTGCNDLRLDGFGAAIAHKSKACAGCDIVEL